MPEQELRPQEGDYRAWAAYHEQQADAIAQQPPATDHAENLGRIIGELDHRAEALGYHELVEQQLRERQRTEGYEVQTEDAKARAYGEARAYADRHRPIGKDLEALQLDHKARLGLVGAQAGKTFDEGDPKQSLLSREDWEHYYKLGGNKAVQEWYFQQKRELHLGRKYDVEQTHEAARPTVELDDQQRKALEHAMRERQLWITSEVAETVAFSKVEENAALNYLRGRAEEYNDVRDTLIKHVPSLEKDLPAALRVDEIRVRQVTQEQERQEEIGLAVAR